MLAGSGGASLKLVLYMTYQPCHHSGGNVPKVARTNPVPSYGLAAPSNVLERIRAFFIEELRPRGVQLELVWQMCTRRPGKGLHPSEAERRIYAAKSQSARDGIQMLLNEGITMRGMTMEDWDFLVSLGDPELRDAWAHRCGADGASPFRDYTWLFAKRWTRTSTDTSTARKSVPLGDEPSTQACE